MKILRKGLLVFSMGLSQAVFALSPQEMLANASAAYMNLTPLGGTAALSIQDAEEVQRMLVLNLRPRMGEIVGYKAALTSKAAQERFGVDQPVSGVMLENMFTSTGSTIRTEDGINLLLEADLLVRVGDERINQAENEDQVLAALSEVIPFLEVPDTMFQPGTKIDAGDVISINAGARIGVMGYPVQLAGLENPADKLAGITFVMQDGNGKQLAEGSAKALMGHPLTAALWLKNDLNRQGVQLKVGDLLSLGGMHRPLPAKGQDRIELEYKGLGDQPSKIIVGIQ